MKNLKKQTNKTPETIPAIVTDEINKTISKESTFYELEIGGCVKATGTLSECYIIKQATKNEYYKGAERFKIRRVKRFIAWNTKGELLTDNKSFDYNTCESQN